MPRYREETLFEGYEIRDTAEHPSEIIEWNEEEACTIWVSNTHDQDLIIQVKGNRLPSTLGSVNVGSSFTLSAGKQDSRTLTPNTSGWLPYIYITAKAATAPTKGAISAYALKR